MRNKVCVKIAIYQIDESFHVGAGFDISICGARVWNVVVADTTDAYDAGPIQRRSEVQP
jgi:hypothetical protein